MKIIRKVKTILDNYRSDSPGVKASLARMLMQGRLGGSGKMVILPVNQGFEHGPARSFAVNPDAYDPLYHFWIAINAGLSAYAAPLGMIEAGADKFAGQIPTILKLNSSNSLARGGDAPSQPITGSVAKAVRLGSSGVGFTIYPGSDAAFDMIGQLQEMAAEAKALGLAVLLWSYPRGGGLSKPGETALDVAANAAHMAALVGAHIIKIKPPTEHLEQDATKAVYEKAGVPRAILAERVGHIMQNSFAGRRIVIFSGGAAQERDGLLEEIRGLRDGGAYGSIIGRNTFQRARQEALALLSEIIGIYKDKPGS